MSDWTLELVGGRTYAMCKCSWSPPLSRFDFEKGFALPMPSSLRAAAQSLLWALESVAGCEWLTPGSDSVIVATKHELLAKSVDEASRWVDGCSKCPKGVISAKALIAKIHKTLIALNSRAPDFVTVVHIQREAGDPAVVDLDENRTEEGFDMKGMVKKGADREEIEEALQETRMRGVMAEKLLKSGARCYRPKARH